MSESPAVQKAIEAIRAADSGDHLESVLALSDHLRDALWRIESARLGSMEAPAAFVCGMGGSAIGGDLAAAAFGDRLTRPLLTVRGYGLPSWAPAGPAVLCSSYSGQTEETLASFAAAEALDARRLVATTGGELADLARSEDVPVVGLPAGLQPRAAVGYMFACAAELAALAGAGPRINTEIDAAAARLEQRRDAILARSVEIADALGHATVVIHGSALTDPVAYRWACEINENAKLPAFRSTLSESNHNQIAGWAGAAGVGRYSCVFLEDSDQPPRGRRRFGLTESQISSSVENVVRLEVEGETRTERLLELVQLGDLVSLHLAARHGVDPSSMQAIDALKAGLDA
ncbi:MAG: bifunctional phosphoglucose/phosphomannose isomerase [Solirubrobacterales bacterium]|nr:bifunctional phosphoglucose/phosphomannose isomerase [Solirubrobacterales bacterium]